MLKIKFEKMRDDYLKEIELLKEKTAATDEPFDDIIPSINVSLFFSLMQ